MPIHAQLPFPRDRAPWLISASLVLMTFLLLSGWRPFDRLTWWLEVAPVLIALPVLWLSYRRFPLSTLLYACIFLHACILLAGGAYTYARVPLGHWVAEWLGLARNPYDKLGHFAQGFVPALVAREVLLRGAWVRGRRMLGFLVLCVVLAISASYELIEWGAAVALGQGADEFLGTQGDPFDTQSDMGFALLGGFIALVTCASWQDRQISRLAPPPAQSGPRTGMAGAPD